MTSETMKTASEPLVARIGGGFICWLIILTLLGGALRLYKLGDWSFWEDEIYTVQSALRPIQVSRKLLAYEATDWGMRLTGVDFGKIVSPSEREKTADRYPPADDYLVNGVTPFRARIASCVIGIVSVPLLMFFAARVLGVRGAIIFGLLLATSPWHIFWSQSARFYTQQFLFYNLALLIYFDATERRSSVRFVVAMVMMALATFSQPPAIFICVVFAVDYIAGLIRRERVRVPVIGWVLGCVVVGLFLVAELKVQGSSGVAYWGKLTGHSAPILVLGVLWRSPITLAVVAGFAAIALWRQQTRLVIYLIAGAVVPLALLVLLSFKQDYYVHVRYAFIVHGAWLALAALGLSELYRVVQPGLGRFMGALPIAAVIVAMMYTNVAYFTKGEGFRRRWAPAFEYIQQHRQPGDDVASSRKLIATYYLETTELADFPKNRKELLEIDQPTWLIAPMASSRNDNLYPYVDRLAELKAYYDVRTLEPFSSIRVYYYDPATMKPVSPVATPIE